MHCNLNSNFTPYLHHTYATRTCSFSTVLGETVDKLYSCTKAADVRDAMAKALYARLFHWIVARINKHLQPQDLQGSLGIGQ